MKKTIVLLLVFALTLSLCGCKLPFLNGGIKTPASSISGGIADKMPSQDQSSGEESSSGKEESKPEEAEDITLVCPMEDSMYAAGSIVLKPDFTFEMSVNLYEGFGNIKGTYEYADYGVITFNVTEKNFSGFVGDTVQAFELQPSGTDKYTIAISDVYGIGAVHNGAVFTKE